MAPSVKELETPVAATTASAAGPPKTATQPVALEIPVTVNGARTVEGSDKRVPFSESTQTVLVFPHGAVIRIAAALASGQLVFLTNENTKKEVVCQVVKSKSSGAAGSYVELQFTEPAPGYWGPQLVAPATTPAAPRPAATAPLPASKPVAPAAAPAPKAPLAAKPVVARPASSVIPAKPAVAVPVPAPVNLPPPVATHSNVAPPEVPLAPLVPPTSAPTPSSAVPPPMAPPEPAKSITSTSPAVPHSVPNATSSSPASEHTLAAAQHDTTVPPLRDYSKQIEALFSSTQPNVVPAPPEPSPARISSDPTTEDLKLQAARLKEQLGSLLFTEAPAAPKPPATVLSSIPKPEAPAAEIVKKADSPIVHKEPKPVVEAEVKALAPAAKPAARALGADEEVKIPSWLAPLSQAASETASVSAASTEAVHEQTVSVNSEESFDALVPEETPRLQTAVFGKQLLGEASSASTEAAPTGSKKGLFLGLAGAALVVLAGGGWYFYRNQSKTMVGAAMHTAVSAAADPAVAPAQPAEPVMTTPSAASSLTATATASQPSKKSSPASIPSAVPNTTARNAVTAPDTDAASQPLQSASKASLGGVHLAAPVVNHVSTSQSDADSLQGIDAKPIATSADPFASGSSHGPAAPLPVGGDVKAAQLLRSVAPEYPAIAKAQHISGRVQIDALIDASGDVASVKVISGPALLLRAATDAVKQWKYKPAMLDGQATPMHLTVTVEFRGQ
jgi:TonB family protein